MACRSSSRPAARAGRSGTPSGPSRSAGVPSLPSPVAHPSPILPLHEQADALLMDYGPPETNVQVVAAYGELELEYAAIRKHAALFDLPQRTVIEVTGAERLEF